MRRYLAPTRASFIPKGAIKVSDKQSDAVAYLYDNQRNGKPAALVFAGKAEKPAWQFWFRDAAARERRIAEFFQNIRAQRAAAQARRTERKEFVHQVKPGDIFRTCWGYDQTNVEFFEVIEVKGKFAILREVAQASEYRGGGADSCVPQSGQYLAPRYDGDDRGQPIRRLIQPGYKNEPHIKIDDVRGASPWGARDPITGTVIGRPVHQTAFGWGH